MLICGIANRFLCSFEPTLPASRSTTSRHGSPMENEPPPSPLVRHQSQPPVCTAWGYGGTANSFRLPFPAKFRPWASSLRTSGCRVSRTTSSTGNNGKALSARLMPPTNRGIIEATFCLLLGGFPSTRLRLHRWRPGSMVSRSKTFANQSCNHLLSNLRTILAEALRKGHIQSNPAEAVKPLSKDAKTRGILTAEEVKELLGKEGRTKYWSSTLLYVLNLVAATTGMRMGELQALTWEDLCPQTAPDRIIVRHSWDRRFGVKSTKSGKERVVPLPLVLVQLLQELNQGKSATGFIFQNTTKTAPIHENFLLGGFYEALTKLGITEADRVARNITFHGWRHFFNTLLRRAESRIPRFRWSLDTPRQR